MGDVRAELDRIWRNARQRHWLLNRIKERAPAGVDPRDVMQEAALRVLEYADAGNPIGNVYAVLVTTALRICIDLRRSPRQRYAYTPPVTEEEGEGDFWGRLEGAADTPDCELRLKYDFAMEKLMRERRMCYLMRELLGMSFEEIAKVLGLSASYVAQSYKIAKRKEAEYVRGAQAQG